MSCKEPKKNCRLLFFSLFSVSTVSFLSCAFYSSVFSCCMNSISFSHFGSQFLFIFIHAILYHMHWTSLNTCFLFTHCVCFSIAFPHLLVFARSLSITPGFLSLLTCMLSFHSFGDVNIMVAYSRARQWQDISAKFPFPLTMSVPHKHLQTQSMLLCHCRGWNIELLST